jgi:hypothetical protein
MMISISSFTALLLSAAASLLSFNEKKYDDEIAYDFYQCY